MDKIKEVNQNYVTLLSYKCSYATNKTDSDCSLLRMNGSDRIAVATKRIGFESDY